jgi:hypothetical protein
LRFGPPPRPFLVPIAARAALLWTFLHAVAVVGGGPEGVPVSNSIAGTPAAGALILAVVLIVMRIELWRRSEVVFLANLGCSFARVAAFIALECAVLEAALRLTVA